MFSPQNQSAFDIINDQLNQWGIGELADAARQLILQGLDSNAVTIELQNTPQYQQRFSGNADRIKAGLPALTPAQYVATEQSYKQVLSQFGLPAGFYDSPQALHDFIAKDVSPQELQSRAQIAQQVWLSNDADTKTAWRSFYGLSDGTAIANILDPKTALPIIQREANAAQAGGEMLRQGLSPDQQRLEGYSDQGYTVAQMDKGIQQTAAEQQTMGGLSQRFGIGYDQGTALDATIGNNATALATRQRLISNETALFSSRSAADSAALGRNQNGQF